MEVPSFEILQKIKESKINNIYSKKITRKLHTEEEDKPEYKIRGYKIKKIEF